MSKPVLIVIDMLNDFLEKWPATTRARLIANIDNLVHIARQASVPVIWIHQEFEPDLSDAFPEMRARNIHTVIENTPGAQIDSTLHVAPEDTILIKKRYSAFFRTSLDQLLEDLHPGTLILAGINTHACIRTTAIDAYQRDWPLILATDCIDSYDRPHHDITLAYLRDKLATLLTNQEIATLLSAHKS